MAIKRQTFNATEGHQYELRIRDDGRVVGEAVVAQRRLNETKTEHERAT